MQKVKTQEQFLKELTQIKEQITALQMQLTLAQEALWESADTYRKIVEHSSEGICVIQDGVVQYANQQLASLLGYTKKDNLDNTFINYIHPEELAKVLQKYERFSSRAEEEQQYETALIGKLGKRIEVEFKINPTSYAGKKAALVLIRDISQRKLMEKYIKEYSRGKPHHSICPECRKKFYPEFSEIKEAKIKKAKLKN